MDRLIATNSVIEADADTAPASGTPQFATDGDAGAGIPRTLWPAYQYNAIQEEIIGVLVAGGLTPDKDDNGQLAAAIAALIATATPHATQTIYGTGRIATAAEALTGTDAAKWITSAVLRAITGELTGAMMPFAMSTPPTGWLECDGSAISRTVTYDALFAKIGTTWGIGNGTTTFNIPDFRGYFLRGWDHGRGIDPARAFASAQADANLAHTHDLKVYSADATGNFAADGSGAQGGTAVTESQGGSEARPKNYAALICIKY